MGHAYQYRLWHLRLVGAVVGKTHQVSSTLFPMLTDLPCYRSTDAIDLTLILLTYRHFHKHHETKCAYCVPKCKKHCDHSLLKEMGSSLLAKLICTDVVVPYC